MIYKLKDVCEVLTKTVNPQKYPEQIYDLYSLPSFDNNKKFENTIGKTINSNKIIIKGKLVLFNKLNLRFKRIWNVDINNDNSICSTEFIPLKSNPDLVDNDYLYYLLLTDELNESLIKSSTGTSNSHQRINKDLLLEKEISFPSIEEQIKIAKILKTIDKKIEFNKTINAYLYDISKALYQEYFENEEYTNNYEIKQLSDVTTNNRSKIDQTKEYKVLSAVNTGNLVLSDDYFDKQVYSKDIGKYLNVNKNDFAYNPARINIGSIGLNTFDFNCCVSPVYVTFSVDKDYIDFFDFYFKSKKFNAEVTLRASGSVRQALNYNDFGMIEIPYPTKEMIDKFNSSYKTIKDRINKNKAKISNLEQIRDTLLPKLMNGEIDLNKIEI